MRVKWSKEELARMSTGEKLTQICCITCTLTCVVAVDIAALAIGLVDEEECGKEKKLFGSMTPDSYLVGGGLIGLLSNALTYIGGLLLCRWYSVHEPDYVSKMRRMGAWRVLISILIFIWSIFGFVFYANLSNSCKASPIGEVMLAWAILRLLLGLLGCISGSLNLQAIYGQEPKKMQCKVQCNC